MKGPARRLKEIFVKNIAFVTHFIFSFCFSVGMAQADQDIFNVLLSQYQTGCDIDDEYTIDPEDLYSVQFGPNDTITAYVVDPGTLSCGGQNVGICGSRGCPLKVYVEGVTHEMVGWSVVPIRVELQSLLMVRQSGWMCGDDLVNSNECWALWEWSEEEQRLVFLR